MEFVYNFRSRLGNYQQITIFQQLYNFPKLIFKSENYKSGDKCDDKARFDQEICTAIDDFRWAFNNFPVTVKGTNPEKNV
jgi:hypothetical protein